MAKYFPIKTETSCKLKWSWSTVRLYNGGTNSCHRVDPDFVTADTFDTFHNTPKKLADRELMLDGQWPTGGCEYCQRVEAAGGSSDRMFHLRIPDQYPKELDTTPRATQVSPTILEVYLDNVCNMSCLYCWDGFSSQIQQENNKHGRFEQAGVVIENRAVKHPEHAQLKAKFWEWMQANSQSLSRLHILGGEPFYQEDFEAIIAHLKNPHPDLEFNIVSNLMIKPSKFKQQIDSIRDLNVKRVEITASIDCWGPEQEYVRHGIDLKVWQENFEYLVEQRWLALNVNQTISGLAIKTMPEMIQYINRHRANRPIGQYMSTAVMTYSFLRPGIFGKGFFDSDFDAILRTMPLNTWDQRESVKYMKGIVAQVNSCEQDLEEIQKLIVYLTELDRRRNTNWRTTFPWLEQYVV